MNNKKYVKSGRETAGRSEESAMTNDNKKQEDKFIMMTTRPVEQLVCQLAIPTIIAMMITAFYNMADTYFVSKIGTSAAGAVGIAFSMMAIIQALGFLFGHGSGNYMSRKLGEKKPEEAKEMAATGFYTSMLAGAVIAALGIVFINPLSRMLGSTTTILPYAREYLKYILVGAPFMMASFVLNNQLRFQGNAMYGMYGICIGALVNIALDPILIFGCKLGIAGAAIATSTSQFISLCCLYMICNRKSIIKIKFKNFKPRWLVYREIIRGGLPSLFRQSIASISAICLNYFARQYGDAAIAALSIVSRVSMFAMSALIGFGQGFQPVCGFNYGANKFNRVSRAFWFCVKSATIVLAIMAILGFIFAFQVIGIFKTGEQQVLEIGVSTLKLQCLSFPLMGFLILSNMMLQTIGEAVKASVLSLARQGLCYIPVLFILAPLYGMAGIKLVQPIADLLAFALSIPLTFSVLKEMKKSNTRSNYV
ncbi:MATE family efflux transporter [Lachnotalea glycerini]|nr:MATE family efflux transporter [Lachnotalea glycerini]